jgi:hypothetical protein
MNKKEQQERLLKSMLKKLKEDNIHLLKTLENNFMNIYALIHLEEDQQEKDKFSNLLDKFIKFSIAIEVEERYLVVEHKNNLKKEGK